VTRVAGRRRFPGVIFSSVWPIALPESDEKLLDECEVETYRSGGSGGQHVNKTDSAVRLRHMPTGIVVTSQQERSQYLNKQICIEKLREKVAKMNLVPKKRIATKPHRGAKGAKKRAKTHLSTKKKGRSGSWRNDDE
jgi:ribosome-associated protein